MPDQSAPCAVTKPHSPHGNGFGDCPGIPQPAEQPMPTPNDHPSIQGLVRADLEARELLGIQRYGTTLQPHNGRDALRDAYEEALDLACYLRQAIEERDGTVA